MWEQPNENTIIVTIPKYIREVQVSKAQRPVYYTFDGNVIKAKGKYLLKRYMHNKSTTDPKEATPSDLAPGYKILATIGNYAYESYDDYYQNSPDRKKMSALDFSDKAEYILYDMVAEEPVIANDTQAGKPRIQIISGQAIYSGMVSKFLRNKMMWSIKKSFLEHLISMPQIKFSPMLIRMEIHDTVVDDDIGAGGRWDIDNRAYPYAKAFPDLLANGYTTKKGVVVMNKKIPDDDRMYITQPPAAIFCPVETFEERKLVFIIKKDERPIITSNGYYNGSIPLKKTKIKSSTRSRRKQMKIIDFKNDDT